MGSQLWCYSSLSRHVIQVCGMLHQSGSTFRHGALFLILHFQMVSTRCKRNGKSTVVLHFAFQTHHPGLRNVAPIWIHIPTWCTFSHPTFANGDSYMFNLVTCSKRDLKIFENFGASFRLCLPFLHYTLHALAHLTMLKHFFWSLSNYTLLDLHGPQNGPF